MPTFNSVKALSQDTNSQFFTVVVPVSDLQSTAATSLTQTFRNVTGNQLNLNTGDLIRLVDLTVDTPFTGGAVSAITAAVGIDYTTATDSANGLLSASSVFTGAVGWAGSTWIKAIDTGAPLLTWASTGANLSALTAGQLRVTFEVKRIADVLR